MNNIEIRQATEQDSETLAYLGRTTYVESHGHFVQDKNDLDQYINSAFSLEKVRLELRNNQNLFYLLFANQLPVGYAKLVQDETHESLTSQSVCRLERIYILEEYIPLKLGRKFLLFLEEQAKNLQFSTLWLSVYIKNERAIRFYEKNEFKEVGRLNFLVNGKEYDNFVLSKEL